MKNYVIENYKNWNDLSVELTADLNELVAGPVVAKHSKFGDCSFTNLVVSINDSATYILADFAFATENKKLAVNVLLDRDFLTVENTELFETLKQFSKQLTGIQAEIKTVSRKRFAEKQEADRQEKEKAKQEAKYQATMEKAIQEFEVLTRKERTKVASGEFYYNLGWLAKNVNSISATLPDYLLKYFEKHFGTNCNPTVVDSKKKTISGHAMQWGLSMKASVSKKAVDTIPAFLKQYLNSAATALTNTSFVWELVDNYGFSFGKTQDLNEIRKTIPDNLVEYFEKGYNGYTGEEGYAA